MFSILTPNEFIYEEPESNIKIPNLGRTTNAVLARERIKTYLLLINKIIPKNLLDFILFHKKCCLKTFTNYM